MKPPIIVVNDTTVGEIYPTASEAEAHMEAIDVEEGMYRVYDSEGLVLEPQPQPDDFHVRIVEPEVRVWRPDEVEAILREYARKLGSDRLGVPASWVESAPPDELLETIERFNRKWAEQGLAARVRRLLRPRGRRANTARGNASGEGTEDI